MTEYFLSIFQSLTSERAGIQCNWTGTGLATHPVDGDGQTAGRLGWQRTDCLFEMQPAKLKCSPPNCDAHGCMKMQSGLHEAPKTALSPALMQWSFALV